MRKLDEQERAIIRQLIKNPRISDNKISKNTGIPVMSVNRKRKRLEEEKLLRYYVSIDKGEFGLRIFDAKQLYVVKFRIGITRRRYMETLEQDAKWRMFNSRYISQVYLGEKDGHLALVLILDAPSESELEEEFNGRIVKYLTDTLGDDCIEKIYTTALNKMVRVHHNYMPATNMERGVIKDEWPDDLIFVDEVAKYNQDAD
ncbi:MAG: winged helix-turn-helix domain-containing protein [Nanoarchaeota archaeon]